MSKWSVAPASPPPMFLVVVVLLGEVLWPLSTEACDFIGLVTSRTVVVWTDIPCCRLLCGFKLAGCCCQCWRRRWFAGAGCGGCFHTVIFDGCICGSRTCFKCAALFLNMGHTPERVCEEFSMETTWEPAMSVICWELALPLTKFS